jgi:predicted permease
MQDLRLAVRSLRATPIVTAVAIVSLTLGIGANTAIFTLVNGLLLRALPVADPQRLVILGSKTALRQGWEGQWSYQVWDQIRQRPELFDGAVTWSAARFNLAGGGKSQFVDGLWTNSSFFKTLGVPLLLGRTFTDADDVRGGGPSGAVAVLSYGFWQRHFGGTAEAVGRIISLDDVPFTIIGVTPPNFLGLDVGHTFDVIAPLGDEPLVHGRETWFDQRGGYWFTIMARLKAGQTRDAATAALQDVQRQIWEATVPRNARPEYRERYLAESFSLVPAMTGTSTLRRQYERPLMTLLAVVMLVLLIACANVANLMLGRGAARRRELSLRVALGASRWSLVRQLLAEALILAASSTGGGWLIASWASRMLVHHLSTPGNTVALDLSIDSHVLLFTIGVAVATVVLFGVAPALKTSGVAPMDALREHGRGAIGDARVGVVGSLIVGQVAVSVVLVVAAGMFTRTFISLATRHPGFERDRILLVAMDAGHGGVAPVQLAPLHDRVREAIRAVPGVGAAAISMVTPVSGFGIGPRVDVSGAVPPPGNAYGVNGVTNVISPGWFATLGTPLTEGRDFTDGDRQGAPLVAIVNRAVARQFLNGASPLGRTVTLTTPGRAVTMGIVGVAADSVYMSMREVVPPTVYTPLAQFYMAPALLTSVSLSVRATTGSPVRLTKSVAEAIGRVNPRLSLTFRPLADQIDASLIRDRLMAILSGFVGSLALLLAAIGLYGVTAYGVARRRAEIGIRLALGSTPAGVIGLMLSRVSQLVGGGVLVGAGISLWASKFVASLLYGLEPRDPATLIGAAAILAAVGTAAGWLPAFRASRIDPAAVLRDS